MWSQPIIVENKAGAARVIAAEYVATQPSDGSPLLIAQINSHALTLQPKLRHPTE
jgi:tripartite-type tricarboxylate transporter receptor subunit TctC